MEKTDTEGFVVNEGKSHLEKLSDITI